MKNAFKKLSSLFVACLTSTSLIAMPSKSLFLNATFSPQMISYEENISDDESSDDIFQEINDAKKDEITFDHSEDTEPYLEDQNIAEESNNSSIDSSSNTLYDPSMNYGTGAPKPTPNPLTTKQRNIVAFIVSSVLAVVAMLSTAHNAGRSPAPGTPKCPS